MKVRTTFSSLALPQLADAMVQHTASLLQQPLPLADYMRGASSSALPSQSNSSPEVVTASSSSAAMAVMATAAAPAVAALNSTGPYSIGRYAHDHMGFVAAVCTLIFVPLFTFLTCCV